MELSEKLGSMELVLRFVFQTLGHQRAVQKHRRGHTACLVGSAPGTGGLGAPFSVQTPAGPSTAGTPTRTLAPRRVHSTKSEKNMNVFLKIHLLDSKSLVQNIISQ